MGLDMYLTRKHNVRNWSHKENKQYKVTAELNDNTIPFVGSIGQITAVSEEVLCWRKANAIHKWFVENVQEGNDDCGIYEVTMSQIQELRQLCLEVIVEPTKANELLPCTQGCFFGSQEYDEYYFEDLLKTVKVFGQLQADAIKAKEQGHSMWLEYSSSW